MQKSRAVIWGCTAVLMLGSFYMGKYLSDNYLHNEEQKYKGIWKGLGVTDVGVHSLPGSMVLIVEQGNSRVSINTQWGEYSYSADAKLSVRHHTGQHVYFELTDRTINGLDEFVSDTGIQVPRLSALLTAEVWRIESGYLMLNILNSGEVISSFKLSKKHQL